MTTRPTIDGILAPGEWPEDPAATFRLDRAEQCLPARKDRWKGPPDASAVVTVAADAEALYLSARVTDDVSLHTGEPWWVGDSLELFLDTDRTNDGPDATGAPPAAGYRDDDWQIFLMPANPNLRWGVAFRGPTGVFDDGGLAGVEMAFSRRDGGSYDLELRLPLSNFPGLSGGRAAEVGFALALNDVDRFVPSPDPLAGAVPDPATYLSWNRGFELYHRPANFGVLELPARPAPRAPEAPFEGGTSLALIVAALFAVALVIGLVGPGSRRLARAGPRPKAVLLGLDVLLAGFLALLSSCEDREARARATATLDAAFREADGIARQAGDLGALDPRDASARARTLVRLLAGEGVPCVAPVESHAFVPLAASAAEGGPAPEYRIQLSAGVVEDWPLPASALARAVKLRLAPTRDTSAGRPPPGAVVVLGSLLVSGTDGKEETYPVTTSTAPALGERWVRIELGSPRRIARLRYTHAAAGPAALLAGVSAVDGNDVETPLVLPAFTEDRIPVLSRPGARPGGTGPYLGLSIPPGAEREVTLPALPGADRLWVVLTAERAFPLTRHGLPVAELRVAYAAGEGTVHRVLNGDDVDEERLNQPIRHPADMRSRIAYRWTDAAGVPRHHDLLAVPLDWSRRPTTLRFRNLATGGPEGSTGILSIASATVAKHVGEAAGGLLRVRPDVDSGRDRVHLAPEAVARLAPAIAEARGDAVRRTQTVGVQDHDVRLPLAAALPSEVGRRAASTRTALLTCLVIAAFLLVLLVVDAVEGFRRLSPRLVVGVLAAALLPLAVTIALADRRNASRLEQEREGRVRGWLSAARGAIGNAQSQGSSGAAGLLQLVSTLPDRSDPTRLRDQVAVYRRQGLVGGPSSAVLVKGRDIGTLTIEPEAAGARVDGSAFLADRADAAGLYASPWDGLLLVATARSVSLPDWRKVVLGLRVDDDFVQGRLATAIPDPDAEVVVLTRTGEVAGVSGPGARALARAVSTRLPALAADAGGRDAVAFPRLSTEDGPRLALLAPLGSAESPDAPAAWLAVGVARRGLDDDLRGLREELLGLGLAAAVLVAAVAATLARRIAGPVRDLVAVTDAVRRGEFDVEVPPPGTDEVGDLAVAFDQMRRELKQRVGDLGFLRRAQEAVSGSLDLAATAEAGLALFRERWSPDVAMLLLALSPSGPVQVRGEAGRRDSWGDRPVDAKAGGWLAAALAATEPLLVEDAVADARVVAEGAAGRRLLDGAGAWLAVPLRAGGEVQGLAMLGFAGTATLPTTEARALLSPLGGVVALAVHNARLYRLAALDEATALPGATAFESALRREVDAALAGGPAAVVLRIGLDGLERVTLRRSVETGRALLRAAADALRSAVGGRVQAGRIREDEFAVRAPGLSRDDALALAGQIRERLAAVELRTDDGDPIRTPVSVGVARCPEDAKSVEFLLDSAGRALAAARQDGGDRVVDVTRLDAGLVEVPPFEDGAIFRTERMVRLLETARRGARTNSTVLLTGETGVGKEVLADLIHRRSPRAEKPFVKINTAAFPESLLESELFGIEKGAFTGADRRREGRFEMADGGTIFLDEVGEMSLSAQVRLLRVLAEGQLTRLGGSKPVDVDVRVVAATNQDLEKAVAAGRFREDLYYRLNVLRIEIPPLRDRREEIPTLVEHFLADSRRRMGRGPARLSPQAMDVLYRHPWPGNVRELRNVIERAVVMCEEEVAGPEHLRMDPPRSGTAASAATPVSAPLDALNERQRRLLEFLAANGRCTNRQYIEMTGASERTGLRDLQELMTKGMIVRDGKRRGAVYRLP